MRVATKIKYKTKKEKIVSIDKALENLKIQNSTFLRMKNLYNKYESFVKELNKSNINFALNNINKESYPINDLNNVNLFIQKEYQNESTKKRRKEQLRQMIRLITNINNLDFPNKKSENNNDQIKDNSLQDSEIKKLFNKIINDETEAISIFQFLIYFGLNVYQISRIKLNSLKYLNNDTYILKIHYNNKKIQRKLNDTFRYNIGNLIKIGKLNNNNYLFFPDIKNINNNSRYIYIFNYLKRIIENTDDISQQSKEILFKFMKTERKEKKFNLMDNDVSNTVSELIENDNIDTEINNVGIEQFDNCSKQGNEEYNSFVLSNISLIDKSFQNVQEDFLFDLKGETLIGFDSNADHIKDFNHFEDNAINDLIWKDNNIDRNLNNHSLVNIYQLKDYHKNRASPVFLENLNNNKEANSLNKLKLEIIFKECNLKFIDEPFSLDEYLMYPIMSKEIPCPHILSGSLLKIFKNNKKLTKKMIYPNLEVKKISDKTYRIEATQDIPNGTLLFEIGGRIVIKQQLFENTQNLLLNSYCYFFLYAELLEKNFKYILIQDKGNIAFFLKETNEIMKNNVILKTYINEENKKLCLLCITCRKIKKGEIILVKIKHSLI